MAMSRKHYRAFADSFNRALSTAETPEAKQAVAYAIHLVADDLKRDNSNFRYDTFFEASGLDVHGQYN